ncbi:FecR family protein [bacterium]|nr:FecR family protein [bacterium]
MTINNQQLDQHLDSGMSPKDAAEFEQWLQDDEHLNLLAARAELHTDLRRSLQRRGIQQEVMNSFHGLTSLASEQHAEPNSPQHTRTHETTAINSAARATALSKQWLILTVAIAAMLLFTFLSLPQSDTPKQQTSKSQELIARVAYQQNADWSSGPREIGDAIDGGMMQLQVGIARLDFSNGATVTLQGPAKFEILSADRTRLHQGILTVHVPGTAIGFHIETPAIDVVDLGTAFGLAVGFDGETDVCVFEGEVEVSATGETSNSEGRLLHAGNAVRSKPLTGKLETVLYKTNRFEDGWPVTSGVLQATGLMKFVSPGPEFVPGRFEDNEHIVVFAEQQGVKLESELLVDLISPGLYQRIHRHNNEKIATGTTIRSYLLQLDPLGTRERNSENKPRVAGQITFDKPIIGLIAGTARLTKTDTLLGHPQGKYKTTRRGIEPTRKEDNLGLKHDAVILSDDRRTLSLDLSAGSAVDQIRVIVQEAEQKQDKEQEIK